MDQHGPASAEIAGDPCEVCAGKGYTVGRYEWDHGTEWEPYECECCAGSGFILPVVETEELIERAREGSTHDDDRPGTDERGRLD